MFISKSEKEELQQKVEDLLHLATQATERAQKSEEKISELSSRLLNLQEVQIEQQLRTIKVIEEFQEIEGLSDKIVEKITTCDSRVEGMEKFFASRYRHYDEMDKDVESLVKDSKNANTAILGLAKRLDNFIDRQNLGNTKTGDQIKMLSNDQKVQFEKILAVERTVAMTRGILFEVKKETTTNKKDLQDLCKIAVTRDEPVFALTSGEELSEKPAVKAKKIRSTKGIKLGPLVRTPEAPWGLKLDGKPRKQPGRKIKSEVKNEHP